MNRKEQIKYIIKQAGFTDRVAEGYIKLRDMDKETREGIWSALLGIHTLDAFAKSLQRLSDRLSNNSSQTQNVIRKNPNNLQKNNLFKNKF